MTQNDPSAERFFLTSYQKSGSHLIMMALGGDKLGYLLDQSHMNERGTEAVGYPVERQIPHPDMQKTIAELRGFAGCRWGHLAYHPDMAAAMQARPTKVLFNVRDPRDIIAAAYGNMLKKKDYTIFDIEAQKDVPVHPLWDFFSTDEQKYLLDLDDPIERLIRFAGIRWQNWLGWLSDPNVRVIHYEDIMERPRQAMKEIKIWADDAAHFGPLGEMTKAAKKRESATFRKGIIGDHQNVFSKDNLALANSLLAGVMDALGYNTWGRIWEDTILQERPG